MTDKTDKKVDKIAALQSLIDGVPTDPRRDATDDEAEFAQFVNDKLLDANAPDVLMDEVSKIAARMFGKYDATEPADVVILNNKLAYLVELVETRDAPEDPLPDAMKRQIQDVLRNKY